MSEAAYSDALIAEMIASIEFEWEQPDDPLVEAASMRALAESLEDMTMVLEGAKAIVVDDVKNHFQEERGPDGEVWAEWSESYAPVAAQTNIGKLRRHATEYLYGAATNPDNYDVAGDNLFINTSDFPEYWAIQQYGGLIMSGGTLVRRSAMRTSRIPERRQAASGHGRIPARPYLGMSPEAEVAVTDLFNEWLEGNIIAWQENPLAGAIQPRMRSGQFGKVHRI